MHPGIVGGEGQDQISLIEVQQVTQLLGTSSNVLQRVMDIGDPQGCRSIRRQLHQSNGPLPRHDILAKIRFRLDHGVQQCRIEVVPFGIKCNRTANFLLGVPDPVFKFRFGLNRRGRNHHACEKADEDAA
jgi:hypothetical protein